ncbi:MAG: methyl-accepting chemotaxis protein [Pseudomonadota bacterium]
MAEGIDGSDPSIGRFDRSFLIQMIKDFFLILVIVSLLEFSLKAGLVLYNFQVKGEVEAGAVAEDISDNVISIMRNEGGPVAARTLYPILERNWNDLGYAIAIEPAEITVAAISEGFGYTPEGIPADFADGVHRAASIQIRAEEFCLGCHNTAAVGDVLGTVMVRTYLAKDFLLWWEDIKLTAGLAVGKIVLHSILLFILLRARMEPLLRLRAVVSNLAKAYGGLDHRAEIRSPDEFGVLARDLNLFLDRISRLIAELDQVLRRVVDVNDDIVLIQGDLRERVDQFLANTRRIERRAMMNAKREPLLSNAWFDAIKGSIGDLDAILAEIDDAPEATRLLDTLRAVVDNAEAQIKTSEELFEDLASLGEDTERFQSAVSEMARLEERMQGIIETGTVLVRRLQPRQAPAE